MTALHPYCGKCGWRKGGLDSWDGTRCRCGLSAPAIVFEIDEESFRDAKTRLDATIADLGTGPLEPE